MLSPKNKYVTSDTLAKFSETHLHKSERQIGLGHYPLDSALGLINLFHYFSVSANRGIVGTTILASQPLDDGGLETTEITTP